MRRLRLALLACLPLTAGCELPALIRANVAGPRPGGARRELVFAETMLADTGGSGPQFVWLDSDTVYRVVTDEDAVVSITPRNPSGPPIGYAPVLFGAGRGIAFRARIGGEYRVEPFVQSGTVLVMVHIFREAADSVSAACVHDPLADGCFEASNVATRPATSPARGPLALILFIAAGVILSSM
jgi:hypothetical protein